MQGISNGGGREEGKMDQFSIALLWYLSYHLST